MTNIITTVGTSLFTNYRKDDVKSNFEAVGLNYAEIKEKFEDIDKIKSSELHKFQGYAESITQTIQTKWLNKVIKIEKDKTYRLEETFNYKCCAEISTIQKIIESGEDSKYKVTLLYTDTGSSKLAAEILQNNLKQLSDKIIDAPKPILIEDLRVENFSEYEKGLINLIGVLDTIIKENNDLNSKKDFVKNPKEKKNTILFNISGGYKGVIPYLTIMAQLYEIDCHYIFEDAENLLSIPKLPLSLDPIFMEMVYEPSAEKEKSIKLDNLKDLSKSFDYSLNRKIVKKMIKNYMEVNSEFSKSVFGHICEFKLFEYFVDKLFKGTKDLTYRKVHREHCLEGTNFDLVLEGKNKKRCFVEVKALNTFLHNTESLTQFKKNIELLKKSANESILKDSEFLYVVYTFNEKLDITNIKKRFKEIQDLNQGITISFKLLTIKKDNDKYGTATPYQLYVRKKIEDTDFQDINI